MSAAGAAGPAVVTGRRAPRGDVRIGRLLRAEWTKATGLRATWLLAGLTLLIGAGIAALSATGAHRQYPVWTAADRAAFDPTRTGLFGPVLVAQLCLGVLGALLVTGEYATGTIRATLTAAPRRGRVLLAKVVLVMVGGLAVGEVCALGCYLLAQGLLAGYGLPHTALGQPHVLRAVLGGGALMALSALLGLGLGAVTRSTVGAVWGLVAIQLLVPAFGGLLPDVVNRWWPGLVGWHVVEVVPVAGAVPWAAGLADLAVTVLGVLGLGAVLLRRRDV